MIDVHAHFAEEGYEFPAEWERIVAAGVSEVVLAADTLAHAREHAAFAESHDGCYFTAGVHPLEAAAFSAETRSALFRLCSEKKCVAVGEIGLDYHYGDEDRRAQREAFASQLCLAEEAGLPVQIHSRDALADTLAVLKEQKSALRHGFLMHCYSYGKENLAEFLSLGAYFSFGGVVCFKNARRVEESVRACPRERILSETDSPYMSPFRGEKNTPANIPVIVKKLAELKECSVEEMQSAIAENARTLFKKLK